MVRKKERGTPQVPDRDEREENIRDERGHSPYGARAEVVEYLEARWARRRVVATTRTPSGQVVDWVPRESLADEIAEPPEEVERPGELDGEWRDERVPFELELPGAEVGPEGTVPLLRVDLERIGRKLTLEELLNKYPREGHYGVLGRIRDIESPEAGGTVHRYAATVQDVTTFGGEGNFSCFSPYTETAKDFSLGQIALSNDDTGARQTVEAGLQEYRHLYGDWRPHLFVFYTTNGYAKKGDDIGGYNQDVDGWVQYDDRIFPGALLSQYSVRGGAQFSLHIKFQLWRDNWWLKVGDRWVGYYPSWLFFGGKGKSLFTTLGAYADKVHFYGEIADSTEVAGRTGTDLGSGHWPDRGWTWSAYQRNLRYQRDSDGRMEDYDGGTGWASDPDMYDIETHMRSGGSWGSYFWYGGPGAG